MSNCCKLYIQTTSSRNENNVDQLNTVAFLNSLLSCLLTVGLSKSVALPFCIQEVPGTNLGRHFEILKGIHGFPKSLQVSQIRPRLLPSIFSLSFYHSISKSLVCYITFFLWCCDPTRVMASSFLRFLDHTQRRTTVGRTPLDEWSARRRDP